MIIANIGIRIHTPLPVYPSVHWSVFKIQHEQKRTMVRGNQTAIQVYQINTVMVGHAFLLSNGRVSVTARKNKLEEVLNKKECLFHEKQRFL